MCHRADFPSRDFVAAIGLRTRIQPNDGGAVLCSSRGVDTSALHLCHRAFGCGPPRCAERYRESCDSRPLRRTARSITSYPRTPPRRWWTSCVQSLCYHRCMAGTTTRTAEPVRADFDRREPRCRICRDETVRSLANELLDLRGIPIFLGRGRFHRITYAEILRDLAPLNEGRDQTDQISYHSLWVHAKRPCRDSGVPENPDVQRVQEGPAGITACRTPIE